jgi:DNA-binding response OmpR family regulator
MHALIIEDEALIAMSIEDALRDCGCDSFDFACSVDAATAAARARRPDLITADVELAPGSGIDAVQAICADRSIPVIFITGTAADVRARLPGHVIVHKPFGPAQVAAAVRLVTSRLPEGT